MFKAYAIYRFKKFISSKEAAVLPMVAVAFPAILGLAGLGMDVGNWMKQRRDLQTAADAAAIAAAYEYVQGSGEQANVEAAALREAIGNGYPSDAGDSEIFVTIYEDTSEVEVELAAASAGVFVSLFMDEDAITRTRAIAQFGSDNGEFCMLSLDTTAGPAVSTFGNVNINATGCGIAVNSNADNALDFGGTSDIDIGDLAIVGDYEVGGNVDLDAGDIDTNAGHTPDPYEDLVVPDFDACAQSDMNGNNVINSDTDVTFWNNYLDSYGNYVLCGNHTISGGDHDLPSGVYIVDGGNLQFTTNGYVDGTGVSFVLTNSGGDAYGDYGALNISAGGDFTLSAPTSGNSMEGILFYQDRNAPSSAPNSNDIVGQANLTIEGVSYFPSNDIHFGGGATSSGLGTEPCSMMIAKTITLSGNPDMGNACDEDSGVRPITGPEGVRLVW
jgi:hypothetical protein